MFFIKQFIINLSIKAVYGCLKAVEQFFQKKNYSSNKICNIFLLYSCIK